MLGLGLSLTQVRRTAESGGEPNAVTYNGAAVTYNAEPVTYG